MEGEVLMQPFHGKIALITGASSGIGRAAALRLAALGADVALAARTESALEEAAGQVKALGRRALVLPTDVADPERCRDMVETTAKQLGQLDILLCCAGISMRSTFAESDPAVLEKVMRVNFFGTMHATWHAIPHVRKTHGSLVALSSLTGKRGTPFYSVYGASKFAIQGLYESLRMELAGDGVHVGVLAPGFVDTPLREKVLGPDGKTFEQPPKLPFRLWPLDQCVERLIKLILRRQHEALLPWFVGPMLGLERLLGGKVADGLLWRRFQACNPPPPSAPPPADPS
jgi:NAD(P)-dependent dehydrogenase (short-subunit alcohol dehydrogenase family)